MTLKQLANDFLFLCQEHGDIPVKVKVALQSKAGKIQTCHLDITGLTVWQDKLLIETKGYKRENHVYVTN